MTVTERWRWDGAVWLTFAAAVGGLALGRPALFVAGVVPLAYVAYGNLGAPPEPTLGFERHVDDETSVPGETVTVRVEVTNEGESVAPDVRVIDGVPGPLPVVDGSPRTAVALSPGGTTAFEYTVRARRGVYEFDEVRFQLRSMPGGHVVTGEQSAVGDSGLRCLQSLSEFPLPDRTRQYVGRSSADEGGEGVEFYGSREYQPGDPASRIDWHRFAGTGELTTVVHREERSRSVVFVLDARTPAAVGSGEGTFTAVELGTYAIERGVRALQEDNHSVGLTVVEDHRSGPAFVSPGGGAATRERIRHVLSRTGPFVADALETTDGSARETPRSGDEAGGPPPTAESVTDDGAADDQRPERATSERAGIADGGVDPVEQLLTDVDTGALVVFVSPLLDGEAVQLLERLSKHGYATTVLSPDVTGGGTWGSRLAGLDRAATIRRVQSVGTPVVDWDPAESLGMALIRAATVSSGDSARDPPEVVEDA